ncbi:MAG: GAF domain-containing protein [Anaerolineae bacterium]
MASKLKGFFSPPHFVDAEKTRIAGILHVFLLIVLSVFVIHLVFELLGIFELRIEDLIIEGSIVLVLLGLTVANRRGQTQVAGLVFVLLLWLAFTFFSFSNRGLRGTAVVAYTAILATAGMLLGWRAVAGFAFLSFISIIAMAYAEAVGFLHPTLDQVYSVAIELNFLIIWGAIALIMATRGLNNALQSARQSEQSLLERNKELSSLAEQVAARTQGLEVVAALGERLNAILDLQQMLRILVDELQARLAYYHVQVFLLDETQQNLLASAGTGAVGRDLETQRFSIAYADQTSLIAQAARTNQPVLVSDVTQAPNWLAQPLLPEIKAEVAIPITLDGKVMGVLAVQDNQLGRVDDSATNILRSLANQVAVAIRNARLFAQVETALAQARVAQERYVAQNWQTGHKAAVRRPEFNARVRQNWQKFSLNNYTKPLWLKLNQLWLSRMLSIKRLFRPLNCKIRSLAPCSSTKLDRTINGMTATWSYSGHCRPNCPQPAENLRLFDETVNGLRAKQPSVRLRINCGPRLPWIGCWKLPPASWGSSWGCATRF